MMRTVNETGTEARGFSRIYRKVRNDGLLAAALAMRGRVIKGFDQAGRGLKAAVVLPCFRWQAQGGLVVRTIQGSRMHLRVDDPGISRELLMTGVHERRTTELVKREVRPGMLVVDIGANLGYYCLLEARLIGRSGLVYGIEPVARNFEVLQRNVESNGYENIRLFNMAMSDRSGTAKFLLTDASNWGSMIDPRSDDKSAYIKERLAQLVRGSVQVPTMSLDEFLEQERVSQVNFIRMDIEGYEIEALRGMSRTLERCKPPLKVLIEVHNTVFRDPLASLGAPLQRMLDCGFVPRVLIAKRDVFHDLPADKLISTLCSYTANVCHLLMEKQSR